MDHAAMGHGPGAAVAATAVTCTCPIAAPDRRRCPPVIGKIERASAGEHFDREHTSEAVDRAAELAKDATRERLEGAVRAAEAVRETWRALEEFNLNPSLALEALFVRLRVELVSAQVL